MFRRSRRKIIATIMTILVLLFLGTLGIIYGSSYYEVYTRNQDMLSDYMRAYRLDADTSDDLPDSATVDNSTFGTTSENPPAETVEETPPDKPAADLSADTSAQTPPDKPAGDEPSGNPSTNPPADADANNFPDSDPSTNPPMDTGSSNPAADNPPQDQPPAGEPDRQGPGARTQEERRLAAYQLSTFYSVAFDASGDVLRIDNEEDNGGYADEELTAIAQELAAGDTTSGVKWNLVYLIEDKGDYTLVAFMNNTIMQESMTTLVRYTLVYGAIALVLFFLLSIHLARRIVEPLEESYTKQRQFISDAGHELKTPVAVITANTEILEQETGPSQWISNIQYETERMGSLVTQLLELARTENVRLETTDLDYSHLVCGEILPFESIAFENGITLSYDITDDLHVNGNRAQLAQLTGILVDNAIRHCAGDKRVHLTLTKERNKAVLSVMNTGDAIPPEQQEQIFERFYRADESRTDTGTHHYGLGLAIAKAIVTAHKGHINVDCHDGMVIFTVRIPLIK